MTSPELKEKTALTEVNSPVVGSLTSLVDVAKRVVLDELS